MKELIKEKYRVLLCGASFSGNMGGYAMYVSFMHELERRMGKCDFTILSKYPSDDKEYCEKLGCSMISFTSLYQLICGSSFYFFGSILKKLHLPYRWLAGKRIKPFFDYDILVDCSGIAFTDDRSNADILINTMWFLPAFVTGIPIVKISQSLGPFSRTLVKTIAKYVLRKIDVVIARGAKSYSLTKQLLPKKEIYELPDMAFSLDAIKPKLEVNLPESYNILAPSYVMENKMGTAQYLEVLCEVGELLWKMSHLPFLLVPHARNHTKEVGVDSKNDDLTICLKLKEVLDSKAVPSICITNELNACELKWIIGHATLAIGSRFHFMIASLSEKIPCMILGWNHKYEEILQMLDLERLSLRHNSISKEGLKNIINDIWTNYEMIKQILQDKVPGIQEKARSNCKFVEDILKKN